MLVGKLPTVKLPLNIMFKTSVAVSLALLMSVNEVPLTQTLIMFFPGLVKEKTFERGIVKPAERGPVGPLPSAIPFTEMEIIAFVVAASVKNVAFRVSGVFKQFVVELRPVIEASPVCADNLIVPVNAIKSNKNRGTNFLVK